MWLEDVHRRPDTASVQCVEGLKVGKTKRGGEGGRGLIKPEDQGPTSNIQWGPKIKIEVVLGDDSFVDT